MSPRNRSRRAPTSRGKAPWPLDLGQRPRRLSPPELELEEPVAGDVVPLREEEVVLVWA